jgi:hypothetical protein
LGGRSKGGIFFGTIREDWSGYGSGDTLVCILVRPDPAHGRGALDHVSSPTYWKQIKGVG